MKKLFLMRGPSGCGKTTLIKNLGLEKNTLAPDTLRTMFYGYEVFENSTRILKKDSYKIFKELYYILEQRMENGLLTIIDHSNLTEINIEKYKSLCLKYGYECIVVNFKVPYDVLVERNATRTDKKVPEEELKKEFDEFNSQKIPSFCKVVKPENMEKEVAIRFQDVSKFKKIVHIGDIHGCATVLKEAIKDINFETLYIFHGDYIDRGLENIEVLRYLISIKRKPNVVLLKGNHELNLIKFVNGEEIYSNAFKETKEQIEKSNLSLRELKDFCKCLKNYYAYNYQGSKVFCTHGGISTFDIKEIALVSEYSFIVGSGDMNTTNIDKEFTDNVNGIYQVHGHRNPYNVDVTEYRNSINLEGEVEKGKYLRAVEHSKNGFAARTYKNNVFKQKLIDIENEDDIVEE